MSAWLSSGNVVLGWILGLASAQLIDWRRTRKRTAAVKQAILYEFNELAFRLAAMVFKLELQHGLLDRETIERVAQVVDRYDGPNKMEQVPGGMSELLKASDDDLSQVVDCYRALQKSSFVPYEEAPYAAGVATQLHELDPVFAVRVLDVLSRLRIFNELRGSAQQWNRMTFDSGLSEDNHARIVENAENADRQLTREARTILDKLVAIGDEYGA